MVRYKTSKCHLSIPSLIFLHFSVVTSFSFYCLPWCGSCALLSLLMNSPITLLLLACLCALSATQSELPFPPLLSSAPLPLPLPSSFFSFYSLLLQMWHIFSRLTAQVKLMDTKASNMSTKQVCSLFSSLLFPSLSVSSLLFPSPFSPLVSLHFH